jgi:16S rRNA (uracil1498-N3)-methyltransferase
MRSRAEAAPGFVRVADLPGPGTRLILDPEDSRYVARVCRARSGEILHLTDGAGGLASARVVETNPRVTVEVEALDRATRGREALLLCGTPEGERADWMVEKMAELGLAVFQPVDCERVSWERAERRFDRWRRVAAAALRQSRARFALEVRHPVSLPEALAGIESAAMRFLASPSGPAAGRIEAPVMGVVAGMVGPSPGLTSAEVSSLEAAGFRPMALSGNRLRTETAAIAWTGWWAAGESGSG